MGDQLVHVKYRPPVHRPHLVVRRRISRTVRRALDVPLTLVSAPAGFGKTTAIRTALQELRDAERIALGWLTLDSSDDDPAQFWAYLIEALNSADPTLEAALLPLGDASSVPSASFATMLANILAARQGPLLLVLDDYHCISQAEIHEGVRLLVAYAPHDLHLMLIVRADPPLSLHRLRVEGRLLEIRTADLRFTTDEVAELLSHAFGLRPTPTVVATLAAQTEGWAAGLLLAGLALRDQPPDTQTALLVGLARSHRFSLDYLAEEVLARQPSDTQRFLMQTAILSEMCGSLCDALTERGDSTAVLEELARRNLFVEALDGPAAGAERWYRYHTLFADLLQGRLRRHAPEAIAPLHRRASAWYARYGDTEAAIEHALAGDDPPTAARLIDARAGALALAGRARTVERWLHRLPPGWQRDLPRANLAVGWALLLCGRHDDVAPYLDQVTPVLATADRALRCEYHALHAGLCTSMGRAPEAIAHARRAMANLPPEQHVARAVAQIALGGAQRDIGELDAAIASFEQAIPLCRHFGLGSAEMLSRGQLIVLYIIQGRLRRAEATVRAALREDPYDPNISGAHVALAEVLLEWDQLDEAEQQLAVAVPLAREGGQSAVLLRGLTLVSRLCRARRDCAAAQTALDEAITVANHVPPWLQDLLLAERALLRIDQGLLAPAAQLLAASPPDYCGSQLRAGLPLVQARLWLAQGRFCEAREHLEQVVAAAEMGGHLGRLIEALVLKALANGGGGDRRAAEDALRQAVLLAEPEGYRRVFLEGGAALAAVLARLDLAAARTLLVQFPEPVRSVLAAPHPLVEPLTEREGAVLRLLADGLTYEQVAAALGLSVNTVRYHVKGIYGKLQVKGRMQAVARARALEIL